MRGLKVMVGVAILLLTLILLRDVLPGRAQATGVQQVELVRIGGSTLIGKTLDVRLVD